MKDTLKILIADDEPLAREILENYAGKTPGLEIVASCKNALEAFSVLSKQPVDLLLLDINMPEINGIELLKTLKDPPQVIFTTAYPEYAVESYDLNAIDYLLKPVSFERFLRAVSKVKTTLPQARNNNNLIAPPHPEQDILFVKSDGKLIKIDLSQLLFVEGLKDYLKLRMESKNLVIHGTMKDMEEQLKRRNDFVRVNKSYIVNMRYISEVEGNIIRIREHIIPIGNTYSGEIREILNRLKLL